MEGLYNWLIFMLCLPTVVIGTLKFAVKQMGLYKVSKTGLYYYLNIFLEFGAY